MSIQSEYTRLVNKYLDGQMSGSEKEIFEEQLSVDPMLKSEFDHQGEIINGLKEYRKAELKTRLDNISIAPGVLGVLSQYATLKTASYVVTSILIGAGVYMYMTAESSPEYYLDTVQSKNQYLDQTPSLQDSEMILGYRYENITEPSEWIENEVANDPVEDIENQPNSIAFEVPSINEDLSSDEIPEPEQILEKIVGRNQTFAETSKIEKVDIENIITNRYKFHYKLEDNKLYLYGKFQASPYEILEINSFQSKKLFFFYDGHYYRLHQDLQSISPLIKIEDRGVIHELNIIKSEK